jgi:hypothetical protein
MRLPRRTIVATLTLAATPALANDHLARVNEVMLSSDGDAAAQFVEIEDPAGEEFPDGGYGLFVYEADGATQAHYQAIVIAPGATSRMTLATEAARAQFGLELEGGNPALVINLGSPLPANGTACFRKQGIDLSCLTWGAATPPIALNSQLAGPAPADGESLQRQAAGDCAALGAPTPHATNAVLTCAPPDDGTDPDGDGASGDDGGCAAVSGTWFGVVATAGLALFARGPRRRRDDHGRR